MGTPPSALASPGPRRALPSTLGCCGRRYLKRGAGDAPGEAAARGWGRGRGRDARAGARPGP